LRLKAGSVDSGGTSALGNDPSHWWTLRASLDITPRHQLDLTVRRVGALKMPEVPAYTAVDARFGWQLARNLEAGLVVRNLFDPQHPEWGAASFRVEHERSALLQILWRP
jgi:iron complex outermembrane receptor protein